ncbi:glycosyltransferase family 2 protein [Veillonella sp.]|uniref:glycosyltransferase n=1 Tax=Veillonella sp. TaxID=1926307 RepID=UPI0025E7A151|nr:glycosyltransferase family 2 protein [Veillonella sp.]
MEIEQPFFSIIMPIYNAEKYLERAVESILKQTYSNFELILIDDQSTDSSYQICLNLAASDSRIEVCQTTVNSGAAATRNLGLRQIKGAYVSFCDSDDYIDSDLLEIVHSYLKDNTIDCLKYGCIEEYIDNKTQATYLKEVRLKTNCYEGRDAIANQCLHMELIPLFGYLWNGFYKAEIITQNQLLIDPKYRVNEDFDFNIRYFEYVNKLQCIDYNGYHYIKYVESDSLSSQQKADYYELHMMKIEKFLKLFNGFTNMTDAAKKELFWLYTRFVYSTLQRSKTMGQNVKKLLNEIKSSNLFKLFMSVEFSEISNKQKVMIRLLRMNNSVLLLQMVDTIGFVKRKLPFLFARIKG